MNPLGLVIGCQRKPDSLRAGRATRRWSMLAAHALLVGQICAASLTFAQPLVPQVPAAKPPATLPAVVPAGAGNPLTERVLQRFRDGDYEGVAEIGPGVLRDDPRNADLRLAVANSLAWTGRYAAAIEQYRALAGTSAAARGEIGIAYIEMWRQRPWMSLPLLEGVTAREPGSTDAKEALGRIRDQLRPRTTLRLGTARDSESVRRRGVGMGHVWWDASASTRLEFSALADRERRDPLNLPYRELGFGVFRPSTPLAPRLDLAAEVDPCRSGYGTVQIEPVAQWLQVRAGRANWGRQVFNPSALNDCLFAARFGLAGAPESTLGRVVYAADFYRVSDGNRVFDAQLRIEPEFLRLGHGFRIDVGMAVREARRNDPRYWSPADGHGIGFVGLGYSRWGDRAGFYVRLQPGTALWGEAKGFNWGASGGGKWQINRSFAIGLDAWTGSNPRPGKYRASIVTLALEYAW